MRSTSHKTLRREGTGASNPGAGLVDGPGEAHAPRMDLGGDASALQASGSRVLLRLLHLSDLHVIDAASPARAEWVEARADDPLWRPLLHMHRPYEALANFGVEALTAGITRWPGDPIDLAVVTGDCIDNAQANELAAYLTLLDGGTFTLPYAGPQEPRWRDGGGPAPSLFWSPTDDRPDVWKSAFGFPVVPDLLATLSAPVRATGAGVDWLGVLGNHDVLRQGTAWTTPALEAIATGPWKHAGPAPHAAFADPLRDFLVRPEDFSSGLPRFPIEPDAGRRMITTDEFIRAHRDRGRGFPAGVTTDGGDYVIDTRDGVRLVALDTNHPSGNFQGSIGDDQLDWLDGALRAAADRPCVVLSHHGPVSLDNHDGEPRRGAPELEAVLHRYGNVVAWLSGHRHRHRITARPDPTGRTPGFWSITTGSVIDWPCQGRVVEIVAGADDRIGVISTVVDHDAIAWRGRENRWLAALHRDLAERFHRSEAHLARPGSPTDRNVLLPR